MPLKLLEELEPKSPPEVPKFTRARAVWVIKIWVLLRLHLTLVILCLSFLRSTIQLSSEQPGEQGQLGTMVSMRSAAPAFLSLWKEHGGLSNK